MILETLGELLKRPDFGPEQVRVQVVKTIGRCRARRRWTSSPTT